MAWIELHQTVWTHRKTLEMAAILGVQPLIAVAHIAQLWTWALDNARLDFDGKRALLTGIRPGVIALGAQWQGDADTFMTAIIESGYVDVVGDDLIIHEWWDRAGKYVEQRKANAERMRKQRAGHVEDTNAERAAHVQRTDTARATPTVPNLTVPDQDSVADIEPGEGGATGADAPPPPGPERRDMTPAEPAPVPTPVPRRTPRYTPDFLAFWEPYPSGHKDDKQGTFAEYQKHKPDPAVVADGMARWKASERWAKGMIVDAKKFAREQRWNARPEPATQEATANGHAPTGKRGGSNGGITPIAPASYFAERYEANKRLREQELLRDQAGGLPSVS